ncbi:MAG: exodeoxyribonuclease III [Rhodanobacteraceae bacterium]
MRIISLNANGIRAGARKGFFDWFDQQDADFLCLQETKARVEQLGDPVFSREGYHDCFHDARSKKGYSGVAIYSRRKPDAVLTELGREEFDCEGRYIEARFGQLSIVSLYFPSGSSGDERQQYKFRIMEWFAPILKKWLASGRDYIISGDWNIVRSEKDIRNWKSNQKNSGCLPEERAWMNALIEKSGWVDSMRTLKPETEEYTWWSNRGRAWDNDVGWRIDYQLVSPVLETHLRDCSVHRDDRFSDHAPLTLDLRT